MTTMMIFLLMSLLPTLTVSLPLRNPSQSACSTPDFSNYTAYPYCDPSLPTSSRVSSLVSLLTLTEKISLLSQDTSGDDAAIPRLGIQRLPFGEALHGDVASCVDAGVCPTSFPHALSLAATFNRSLWHSIGEAIGVEARALNNLGAESADLGLKVSGLMLWTPNLNPYRDPRWGRGHETPGEDPYLSGEYGVEYITGLQGNDPKYLRAASIVKHAFDYDVEGNYETSRTAFDANVSSADDQTNYFDPPFKAIVSSRANASGLMCSYNAINGVPSCMNGDKNNGVVRDQWGLGEEGIIVSDCGAIGDEASTAYIEANFGGSVTAQAAQGILGGCDYNCGHFYAEHLADSVKNADLAEDDVDMAVSRLLNKAFELGLFDQIEGVPFANYGEEKLGTAEHAGLALSGSTQASVLLKNEGSTLPLEASAKVAVIGPHFNSSLDLLSNYRGDSDDVENHTPLLGLTSRGNVVAHAAGCALNGDDTSGYDEAVKAAGEADVAVVFLGLHPQWFDDVPVDDSSEGKKVRSEVTSYQHDICARYPAALVALY
ncbi:hypothetical protein TL16_g07586 [Triparma laevis f. inornata]|uniref:Glycoside hydrolase family 3 N-terminal domain-containing protein n=1 Tax=Triparma laevis f. inornata TaxID=1714386 RepID=A0A9W7EGI9_9STRA|nr:hypothetical protein TL16_g07586 [Triparma laevis f. inornata]